MDMDVVVAFLSSYGTIYFGTRIIKNFDLYENCRCFYGCLETEIEYHDFIHIVMVCYFSRTQEVPEETFEVSM